MHACEHNVHLEGVVFWRPAQHTIIIDLFGDVAISAGTAGIQCSMGSVFLNLISQKPY